MLVFSVLQLLHVDELWINELGVDEWNNEKLYDMDGRSMKLLINHNIGQSNAP